MVLTCIRLFQNSAYKKCCTRHYFIKELLVYIIISAIITGLSFFRAEPVSAARRISTKKIASVRSESAGSGTSALRASKGKRSSIRNKTLNIGKGKLLSCDKKWNTVDRLKTQFDPWSDIVSFLGERRIGSNTYYYDTKTGQMLLSGTRVQGNQTLTYDNKGHQQKNIVGAAGLSTSTNTITSNRKTVTDQTTWLMIGDSYSNRPLLQSDMGWPNQLQRFLDLNDNQVCFVRVSGYGFAKEDHQFISSVKPLKSSKSVRHIVIVGGVTK